MRDRIARASKVIQAASLGDIQLREASFARSIRSPDEVSDELQLEIVTSYSAELADRLEENFFVQTSLVLEIIPTLEETKGDDPVSAQDEREGNLSSLDTAIAWVRAAYELQYMLPHGFEVSEGELSAFAETNGVFNAWPYFREFVQSSMARMGLPPVFLPLFRVPRTDEPDGDEAQDDENST